MKRGCDFMKAKNYLEQLQKLDTIIDQKILELKKVQSDLNRGMTIQYGVEKVQTNTLTEASFTRLVEKKIDLENEINLEIDSFVDKKHKIINQIQDLENYLYIIVLYKRYVEYKSHMQITQEMHYSIQHVQRLQQQALRAFEKRFLNERMEKT